MDDDFEADLYAGAGRVAVDLQLLGFDPEVTDPTSRGSQLRGATLLAGLMWHASITIIDRLLDDIEELRGMQSPEQWAAFAGDAAVISGLPPRFHHRITPVVAARLLVVTVDLTSRLPQGWSSLSCVAQELMLRCLLDEVEAVAELHEVVGLDPHWRAFVEETLFEDLDHEMLYDPSIDGFEEDPTFPGPPNMAAMRFDQWFVPFNPARRLPPYAEDNPPAPRRKR